MSKFFRKSLNFLAKEKQQNPKNIFDKAIDLNTPLIDMKSKKWRNRTVLIPQKIKDVRSQFLINSWMVKSAKEKKGFFWKKFANELYETSQKKSNTSKKQIQLNRLAFDSRFNR